MAGCRETHGKQMGINNAIFEFCMKHSDDPKKRTEGIPERDRADYDWLKTALAQIKTDGERMETSLKIVRESEDQSAVVCALEEILYFVEELDNAIDFFKASKGSKGAGMNASVDILRQTERRDAPEVRSLALQVITACTQNNPMCQTILADKGGLQVLLRQLDDGELNNAKLVSSISALVRGHDGLEALFRSLQGPEKVLGAVVAGKEDRRLCKKALFFLHTLWPKDRLEGAAALPSAPMDPTAASVLCGFLECDDCDLRELTTRYLIVAVKGGADSLLKEAGLPDVLAREPSDLDGLELEVEARAELKKSLAEGGRGREGSKPVAASALRIK